MADYDSVLADIHQDEAKQLAQVQLHALEGHVLLREPKRKPFFDPDEKKEEPAADKPVAGFRTGPLGHVDLSDVKDSYFEPAMVAIVNDTMSQMDPLTMAKLYPLNFINPLMIFDKLPEPVKLTSPVGASLPDPFEPYNGTVTIKTVRNDLGFTLLAEDAESYDLRGRSTFSPRSRPRSASLPVRGMRLTLAVDEDKKRLLDAREQLYQEHKDKPDSGPLHQATDLEIIRTYFERDIYDPKLYRLFDALGFPKQDEEADKAMIRYYNYLRFRCDAVVTYGQIRRVLFASNNVHSFGEIPINAVEKTMEESSIERHDAMQKSLLAGKPEKDADFKAKQKKRAQEYAKHLHRRTVYSAPRPKPKHVERLDVRVKTRCHPAVGSFVRYHVTIWYIDENIPESDRSEDNQPKFRFEFTLDHRSLRADPQRPDKYGEVNNPNGYTVGHRIVNVGDASWVSRLQLIFPHAPEGYFTKLNNTLGEGKKLFLTSFPISANALWRSGVLVDCPLAAHAALKELLKEPTKIFTLVRSDSFGSRVEQVVASFDTICMYNPLLNLFAQPDETMISMSTLKSINDVPLFTADAEFTFPTYFDWEVRTFAPEFYDNEFQKLAEKGYTGLARMIPVAGSYQELEKTHNVYLADIEMDSSYKHLPQLVEGQIGYLVKEADANGITDDALQMRVMASSSLTQAGHLTVYVRRRVRKDGPMPMIPLSSIKNSQITNISISRARQLLHAEERFHVTLFVTHDDSQIKKQAGVYRNLHIGKKNQDTGLKHTIAEVRSFKKLDDIDSLPKSSLGDCCHPDDLELARPHILDRARPQQVEAIQFWENNGVVARTMMLDGPGGSGKTDVGINIGKAYLLRVKVPADKYGRARRDRVAYMKDFRAPVSGIEIPQPEDGEGYDGLNGEFETARQQAIAEAKARQEEEQAHLLEEARRLEEERQLDLAIIESVKSFQLDELFRLSLQQVEAQTAPCGDASTPSGEASGKESFREDLPLEDQQKKEARDAYERNIEKRGFRDSAIVLGKRTNFLQKVMPILRDPYQNRPNYVLIRYGVRANAESDAEPWAKSLHLDVHFRRLNKDDQLTVKNIVEEYDFPPFLIILCTEVLGCDLVQAARHLFILHMQLKYPTFDFPTIAKCCEEASWDFAPADKQLSETVLSRNQKRNLRKKAKKAQKKVPTVATTVEVLNPQPESESAAPKPAASEPVVSESVEPFPGPELASIIDFEDANKDPNAVEFIEYGRILAIAATNKGVDMLVEKCEAMYKSFMKDIGHPDIDIIRAHPIKTEQMASIAMTHPLFIAGPEPPSILNPDYQVAGEFAGYLAKKINKGNKFHKINDVRFQLEASSGAKLVLQLSGIYPMSESTKQRFPEKVRKYAYKRLEPYRRTLHEWEDRVEYDRLTQKTYKDLTATAKEALLIIYMYAPVVVCTWSVAQQASMYMIRKPHYILVDEAARLSEAVTATIYGYNRETLRFFLAADSQQMGPVKFSPDTALMFPSQAKLSFFVRLKIAKAPVKSLTETARFRNPDTLKLANVAYKGSFIAVAGSANNAVFKVVLDKHERDHNIRAACIAIHVPDVRIVTDATGSCYSTQLIEAGFAEVYRKLDIARGSDIVIITGYKYSVNISREFQEVACRKMKRIGDPKHEEFSKVIIETTDSFQGSDACHVVHLNVPKEKGFITDPRRGRVTYTRMRDSHVEITDAIFTSMMKTPEDSPVKLVAKYLNSGLVIKQSPANRRGAFTTIDVDEIWYELGLKSRPSDGIKSMAMVKAAYANSPFSSHHQDLTGDADDQPFSVRDSSITVRDIKEPVPMEEGFYEEKTDAHENGWEQEDQGNANYRDGDGNTWADENDWKQDSGETEGNW